MAKILVADDNSNIQKMVGLALKDQGIDVVAVGNGEAAVRKISDVKPDLVLADVFMPVRNGYEVCKYVKQDSALSHIPVILLVGAFDPLDEQEAQRVGADGVLKKPFVPPDPLISMVKSALARAGVQIGPPPVEEKAPPPPFPAKEFLNPATSSKAAALRAAIPEPEPEPLEEIPMPPPNLKIAAGSEPVAFGSLLDTAEDDAAFATAKPATELGTGRDWRAEEDDDPREEEEESPRGGWRPGGDLDRAVEDIAAASGRIKDWREEAFHGDSPANAVAGSTTGWTQDSARLAEVAEAPAAVGVGTLEPHKAEEAPAPFAGDAWAAALATNIEDKLVSAPVGIESVSAEETAVQRESIMGAASVAPVEETKPAVGWAAGSPDTTWEVDAKKISQLAASWDAPAAAPEQTPAPQAVMAEPAEQQVVESPKPESGNEFVGETPGTSSFMGGPEFAEVQHATFVDDAAAPVQAPEDSAYSNNWTEAPSAAVVTESASEATVENASAYAAESHSEQAPEHAVAPEEAKESVYGAAPVAETAAKPEMDELVARVLAKMNPDVIQKVTQEILKPVIEALIKDELNSKK